MAGRHIARTVDHYVASGYTQAVSLLHRSDIQAALDLPKAAPDLRASSPKTIPPTDVDLTGRIVRVIDGDTVELRNEATVRVRLHGIDTPEKVPWQNLRYVHVVAIKAALAEAGKSAASLNAALSALRKITAVCVKLKLIARDDMMDIHDVKLLHTSRLPAGREVRIGELEAIIRACLDDPHPATRWRDIALLGCLYICGLRRFEVTGINVEDLDRETATLAVVGKGNKERLAYPDPGKMTAIQRWLVHRGEFDGPLFIPVNKSGLVDFVNGRITDQAVYNVVKKRQRQDGVKACAPHDFRRTFGTELLRQGIDLPTAQRLMGHSDPSTTARYDVRDVEEDLRTTRGLHLPIVNSST